MDATQKVPISGLPAAQTPTAADLVAVVQATGNAGAPLATRKATLGQIFDALGGGGGGGPGAVTSVAGKTGAVVLGTADIGGLDAALNTLTDGKASTIHGHTVLEIAGLTEAIAEQVGEATNSPVLSVATKTGHVTLAVADVGGLSAALAAKAALAHTHTASEVTDLNAFMVDGGHF